MALNLTELKAKMVARAAAASVEENNTNDKTPAQSPILNSVSTAPVSSGNSGASSGTMATSSSEAPSFHVSSIDTGTLPIDHLEFLSKLNELHDTILTKHPRLPFLLKQIHTQLSKDPEIVTLLNEEAIGCIVNGLKIQTQTELSGTIAKQSKAKDKKTVLALDMF